MALRVDLDYVEPLLIVCKEQDKEKFLREAKKFDLATVVCPKEIKDVSEASMASVGIYDILPVESKFYKDILEALKPNGHVIICGSADPVATQFELKTNGFVNVFIHDSATIKASKPQYKIGSSQKLNLKKPSEKPAVWKIDDDEEDLIDPDDLLDEDDLKKPDPNSLRVCATTGKRKACKDCSCGLADELAAVAQTGDAPKSSCGSCYLGDAFRCSTCPYLGMPAFKPGEKIQLSNTQLKSDI